MVVNEWAHLFAFAGLPDAFRVLLSCNIPVNTPGRTEEIDREVRKLPLHVLGKRLVAHVQCTARNAKLVSSCRKGGVVFFANG